MFKLKQFYSLIFILLIAAPAIYLLSLNALAGEDFILNSQSANLQIMEETFLMPLAKLPYPEVAKTLTVVATAYSSCVSETDSTPFITASGETVRDGIVANNQFAFGTQVRLPEIFGDKIFIVEDRMHSRKGNYHVDIWFASKQDALAFGAKTVKMQILQ